MPKNNADIVRPRLRKEDMHVLIPLLAKAVLEEKNPEERWKIFRLMQRLEAPRKGHPQVLNMKNISALDNAIEVMQRADAGTAVTVEALKIKRLLQKEAGGCWHCGYC